jgi:hypothetical protein
MIAFTTQKNIVTEPVSSARMLTIPRNFLEADGHEVEVEWSYLHFVPVFRWVAVGLGTSYKELMSTSNLDSIYSLQTTNHSTSNKETEMAPSRQIPTESSSYTPSGEGQRGMADIFAPAPEPKSELAKYRLLAPKCGCESPSNSNAERMC